MEMIKVLNLLIINVANGDGSWLLNACLQSTNKKKKTEEKFYWN